MIRGDSSFLLLVLLPIVSSPAGVSAIVGVFATNILLSFSLCRLILQYPMTSHKSEERSSHGCYRGVNDNEYLVVGRIEIDSKDKQKY